MLIKPMQNTVKHVGPDAHAHSPCTTPTGSPSTSATAAPDAGPKPCTPATACATSATASAPSAAPSPSTPTPAPAYTSTDTYRHENQDPGPQGAAIARTAKILFVLHGTTPGSFRSGRRTEPSRRRSGWW